jgi:hydroxymethylpyrimidine pyrophosphatase-like HAD family hydrolase
MNQSPVAFVDLDDTLFSTRRNQPLEQQDQLVAAAMNAEGQDTSFMNPKQLAFWKWLQGVATVIPTTARTTDRFARVMLARHSYAICAAGSVVLKPNGQVDELWHELVCHRLNCGPRDSLERLLAETGKQYEHSFDPMREHDQIVFYRLRSARRDQTQLVQMHETLQRELPDGWHAHVTNHDVSILRDGCQKRDAVIWLLENRLGGSPFTIGIGDSIADVDFLGECDFAMGPSACQWLEYLAAAVPQHKKHPQQKVATETGKQNSTKQRGFSGSYRTADVRFLLVPLQMEAVDVAEKERLLQSGEVHYSEIISRETPPDPDYLQFYFSALARHRTRVAAEIVHLGARISQARPSGPIALVSLARAGTPIGVLLYRELIRRGRECQHFSLSIIRDRGIDYQALDDVRREFADSQLIFVDGWTGKGTIQNELSHSIRQYNESRDASVSDELAVLLDLSGNATYRATHIDYLLPSGMLNAIVSGMISRSILPQGHSPHEYHGCLFFDEFREQDQSQTFVDEIDQLIIENETFTGSAEHVGYAPSAEDVFATRSQFLERLLATSTVDDWLKIKPGIGEATRAMLRRVPEKLLVRDNSSADVQHLLTLAKQKEIDVEVVSDMPYEATTVIRSLGKRVRSQTTRSRA